LRSGMTTAGRQDVPAEGCRLFRQWASDASTGARDFLAANIVSPPRPGYLSRAQVLGLLEPTHATETSCAIDGAEAYFSANRNDPSGGILGRTRQGQKNTRDGWMDWFVGIISGGMGGNR